jgi:hypothetical protein
MIVCIETPKCCAMAPSVSPRFTRYEVAGIVEVVVVVAAATVLVLGGADA